jgi:tRNA threonylcarbamoyl adenosine modification protein YjeE
MITVELVDASATERLGAVLAQVVGAGDVILLEGDLGSGKTTLVRGLVSGLGAHDRVTSPTFTLRHEYATVPPLTHVDCWRLADPAELDDLGLDEVVEAGGAVVIEWGEFAAFRFADRALRLAIADADGGKSRVAEIDLGAHTWARRESEFVRVLRRAGFDAETSSPVESTS